jgi:hypothetical protein
MGGTTTKAKVTSSPLTADCWRAYHLGMPYRDFVARREKLKRQIQFLRLKEGRVK